jgi:peptidoglycan/xylan/chitin deacetylase (PgdA/CDA1 family)
MIEVNLKYLENAYQDGWSVYEESWSHRDNPYNTDEELPLHLAWSDGYLDNQTMETG